MRLTDQLREDWRANRAQIKGAVVVLAYRLAHAARGGDAAAARISGLPVGLGYRLAIEWVLGVEIPWGTRIGRRFKVFHGVGVVINPGTIIGDDVSIRQHCTVGNAVAKGACPRIGNRVQLGAGSIVIGDITIGDDATIGAGAVVTKDVPAGATVVGNPARILAPKDTPAGDG